MARRRTRCPGDRRCGPVRSGIAPVTFEPPTSAPGPDAESAAVADRPLLRGWLHLGALVATLIGGPVLVAHAHSPTERAALVVYVVSMACLFGVSAAFHRVRWSPAARRRMRRADHATIFLAIAGTYTAVAVLALDGWARTLVLCLVWVGGAAGVTVRQLWLDAPKWAIAVPYIIVGWCALSVLPQLAQRARGRWARPRDRRRGVLHGGRHRRAQLRRPNPLPGIFGYHEVFHLGTVVGAALHFVAIAAYAVPRG